MNLFGSVSGRQVDVFAKSLVQDIERQYPPGGTAAGPLTAAISVGVLVVLVAIFDVLLVFADGLTAPEGELVVWWTPWHEKRVLPALRELLDLPFERVIVSHGEPAHDRPAFERALARPPYTGELEAQA